MEKGKAIVVSISLLLVWAKCGQLAHSTRASTPTPFQVLLRSVALSILAFDMTSTRKLWVPMSCIHISYILYTLLYFVTAGIQPLHKANKSRTVIYAVHKSRIASGSWVNDVRK
ncbi:hypothetical protein F4823DRAFT_327832 [Ustulina deusta]|nr:hypothetical protein F4823DRAFT_327832 [Ustulina deusta]